MADSESSKKQSRQINKALGVFLLFFGIVVLFSIFFTETFVGRTANAIAGLVLCAIGGGMILTATRSA